jgi:hypothetical protein
MRRNEDDRQLPVHSSKVALKLKAASARHPHVEHQASGPPRRIGLEKIGDGRKLPGLQANRPQETRNRVPKVGIVVDHQDTGICVTHPRHPKDHLPAMALILRTIRRIEQHLFLKNSQKA